MIIYNIWYIILAKMSYENFSDLKLIYSLAPCMPEILFFISRGKKPSVGIPFYLNNLLSLYPGVITGSNL